MTTINVNAPTLLVPPERLEADVFPDGYNADFAYVMAVFSSATYNLFQASPLQLPTGWSTTAQFYYTDIFGVQIPIGAVFESSTAVTLAFRGTQTWQELVITDAGVLPWYPTWTSYYIVHYGFNSLYTQIRQSVMTILNGIFFGSRPLYITGHSLGGSLATLAAVDYSVNSAGYPVNKVYTFGSPRVASYITLAQFYDGAGGGASISDYTYRVARPADIVTQIPPPPLYYHVDQLCSLAGSTAQDGLTSHAIDSYIDLLDPGLIMLKRRGFMERPDCAADPLGAQSLADPYPALARLRAETPVAWHERGMWIVTAHADVTALLRDPRFEHWQSRSDDELGHAVNQLGGGTARMALAARFAVFGRARLYRDVAERAQNALARLAAQESFDLMRDFAHPVTFATSSHLCGVPEESIEHLSEITGILDGDLFAALSPEGCPQPKRSAAEALMVHLRAVLATAGDRTVIGLVRELCGTDGIGVAALLLVLYAGHRNMMNAVGNGVLALLEHPDELERARATPSLLQHGVHELLRYDSPLQYVVLRALQSVALRDQRIEGSDQVFLSIGAANRDPAVFAAPDELRLNRHPNDYLSFGSRMSGCPGRLPALVEIEAALAALLSAFRHFRVVEPVIWRCQPIVQRGPASLILGDLARA